MLAGETPRQSRNAWLSILAIAGGVAAAAFGLNEWSKTRYSPAKANVIAITESCEVASRATSEDPAQSEVIEMSCQAARRRYSGSGNSFSERRTIDYRFTSPVDGNAYTGRFHRWPYQVRELRIGQEIDILAHKTDPGSSRQP